MNRPAAVLLCLVAGSAAADPVPSNAIQLRPDGIRWTAGSRTMPPGTQIAVLEGNPQSKSFFTIRLKVPAGARLAPHWHPRDERVTVISGTVGVGFGNHVDDFGVTRFGAGSFYVNPANSRHYLTFPEESVVQITGIGPWEIHFVDAAAAPPAADGASGAAPAR